MIVGATYHQIGKPTKITSYSSIFVQVSAISGRDEASFISIVLRLFLSIQFKSAAVYGIFGLISYSSLSINEAIRWPTFLVTPLHEK